MTKQEKIREGIAQALGRCQDKWGDEFQHNYWLTQADIALNYLHSQSVVISEFNDECNAPIIEPLIEVKE